MNKNNNDNTLKQEHPEDKGQDKTWPNETLLDSNLVEIINFVRNNHLFKDLELEDIEQISKAFFNNCYENGDIIIKEGERGQEFFIIKKGHVVATQERNGEDYLLSHMDPGDGFGEMALMSDVPRSCTIKAVDDVNVLVLVREDFEKFCREIPALAKKMNSLVRERVSMMESKNTKIDNGSFDVVNFSSKRLIALDYSYLDLLMKLNEASGGLAQVQHCKETGQLAREMSKKLCPQISEELLFAGYLHEIGKVTVPVDLVKKERIGAPLTEDEAKMFHHIYASTVEILQPNELLHEGLRFIAELDGNDYKVMSVEAQILKVANDFLEYNSPQYRKLPVDKALELIELGAGTKYNPKVVIALEKKLSKYKEIRVEAQLNVVRMIVKALDCKDNYTFRHSEDVRNVSLDIAKRLNLKSDDIRLLRIGSELHDAGKIFIDEKILNKPGPLTNEERSIMQTHASHSAHFFKGIYGMDTLSKMIESHHEKYDGTGYPKGLKAHEIPLASRIMTIADVWSALTTDRPYRKGMPLQKAVTIMQGDAEKGYYDPVIFAAFIDYIKDTYGQDLSKLREFTV